MQLELGGKAAIVTGGSRGIGAAIAAQLVREGASICLVASDPARLERAAATLRQAGEGKVVHYAVDLRDPAAAAQVVEAALRELGRLDILVNCAGATKRGDFFALSDADWMDGFALKFHGAVRLTRQAWPHLREAGGAVLNIIGVGGRTPAPDFTIGGAVNAAFMHFTKAMAAIGQADGVRVNAINPGRIETDRLAYNIERLAASRGISTAEATAELLRASGIRRFGTPEEIAAVAAFMVSPRAAYMQGTLVDVDGGETRGL